MKTMKQDYLLRFIKWFLLVCTRASFNWNTGYFFHVIFKLLSKHLLTMLHICIETGQGDNYIDQGKRKNYFSVS
jgi:hypothetical protein